MASKMLQAGKTLKGVVGMNASQARIAILVLLVALCAPLANADTIPGSDPRIIINDPVCTSSFTITSPQFTFQADPTGQGLICIENGTGMDLINLSITVIQPPGTTFPTDFVCGGDAFQNCVFTQNGNVLNIFFSGVNATFPGLRDQYEFEIDLLSPGGGWGSNVQFSAAANVPEPGTLTLLGIGLAALTVRRRMKQVARA